MLEAHATAKRCDTKKPLRDTVELPLRPRLFVGKKSWPMIKHKVENDNEMDM
jgi:hypothetical protein